MTEEVGAAEQQPYVWIVFNDGKRQFFRAEPFGDLRNVVEEKYDSFFQNPDVMVEYIRETMIDFRDEDYILMVGEPILCGLVMMVAAELSRGDWLNILRWDKVIMDYKPVRIRYQNKAGQRKVTASLTEVSLVVPKNNIAELREIAAEMRDEAHYPHEDQQTLTLDP